MGTLPPDLLARAREFLDGDGAVSAARHAATVVLLRDGAGGLEVYLLRRAASMAFAAGMHVFPGGAVDPRDRERAPAWSGPSPTDWGTALGCEPSLAVALVCAAVRETFEESGVLLAGRDGQDVLTDLTGDAWEVERLALLDRSHSLTELLDRRGIVLRSDLLRPWAHWITPEFEPRRYDTRFFVAAVPRDQVTRDVSGEADQVVWLPVRDAVSGFDAGELAMLPPTIVALRELSAFDGVAAVLAAERPLRPVLPRLDVSGDDVRLVVDGPDGAVDADDLVRT